MSPQVLCRLAPQLWPCHDQKSDSGEMDCGCGMLNLFIMLMFILQLPHKCQNRFVALYCLLWSLEDENQITEGAYSQTIWHCFKKMIMKRGVLHFGYHHISLLALCLCDLTLHSPWSHSLSWLILSEMRKEIYVVLNVEFNIFWFVDIQKAAATSSYWH